MPDAPDPAVGTGHGPVATVAENVLVYDRWMRISRLQLRMPDGELGERHLEDHGAAVAVLPYDPVRRTALLIRQPRAAVIVAGEEAVLELVAGLTDGEAPEKAARREAIEEAGLALGELRQVAQVWSMVGISTERMTIFHAAYAEADRIARGGGAEDENEAIEVIELPLARLRAMVEQGALTDAKTLIAVQGLMLERPELFG